MKDQRIFDRFGFNLPQQSKKVIPSKSLFNYKTYTFNANAIDWIDENTGECLTGFVQPLELQYLLNNCINTETN